MGQTMNVVFFFVFFNWKENFDRKYQSIQLLFPRENPKENQISTTPETTKHKHGSLLFCHTDDIISMSNCHAELIYTEAITQDNFNHQKRVKYVPADPAEEQVPVQVPALLVHSRQPAVCNTQPMQHCSPAALQLQLQLQLQLRRPP